MKRVYSFHSIALNQQDEEVLNKLKAKGIRLAQIFRKGIEFFVKETKDKN